MNFKPILEAISNHLAIKESEISLPTPMDYDDEFIVMNNPMEVVTREVAFANIEDYCVSQDYPFNALDEISDSHIGFHKRLGNSNYYFRWL